MVTIGNINLFVRDIAAARRFYVDGLGLQEQQERSVPPSFVFLEAGACSLTLQDAASPDAAFGPASSVEIGFAVADVEALHERLSAWSGAVSAVQHMGWGSGFDAQDPDGHRLTFYRWRA